MWQVEEVGGREDSVSQISNFGHEKDDLVDSCHEEHKVNTVLDSANIPYLQTGPLGDILFLSLSFLHLPVKQDESSVEEG